MTSLIDAIRTKDSLTENGMVTNSTSLNSCVDLFFQIGAMRGVDKTRLINVFTKAFGENPLTAMRLLFWARDIRGGAGERQIFKDIIAYLSINCTTILRKNIALIPEFGRWDDMLVLIGTPLEKDALVLIANALKDGNKLTAKWMPRPSVTGHINKRNANAIRNYLKLTPKEYRKLLVENSNTVEQLMCAKEFSKIEYSKLPSKAMSDLMKAFSKNDLIRFQEYLASVEKGEVKINAGAIYPYDIIKNMKQGNAGANVQWDALPNYMEGNKEVLMSMVDVSGSMCQSVNNNPNLEVIDIAISLGLYISERNIGKMKDAFITFTSSPTLQVLKGSLSERYQQIQGPVGYDTNLDKAFSMLLSKAVEFNLPVEEMPTMVLILSDMEFNNSCIRKFTAQEMIENKYANAGYTIPKIVYWNLASRGDNNKPVQFDKNGCCLVSGFSPSLLTSLLAGKDMTPYSMMMTVIDSERYAKVTV